MAIVVADRAVLNLRLCLDAERSEPWDEGKVGAQAIPPSVVKPRAGRSTELQQIRDGRIVQQNAKRRFTSSASPRSSGSRTKVS
jgi:hypothetical protein